MKKRKSGGSELQRVFVFLGVLLILLVGSFFVGMYLGSEVPDSPVVLSEPGDKNAPDEVSRLAEQVLTPEEESGDAGTRPFPEEPPDIGDPLPGIETASPAPAAAKPSASAKSPSSGPVYAVQVGAFRNESKATERVALLRKKGYDAYIVPPESGGSSSLHKVRVGHFGKKQDADALSRKIREREGLQTFVTYR